jgi:hypothetical protein
MQPLERVGAIGGPPRYSQGGPLFHGQMQRMAGVDVLQEKSLKLQRNAPDAALTGLREQCPTALLQQTGTPYRRSRGVVGWLPRWG